MSRAQQSHLSQASASSSFSYQSKPLLLAGVQDAYWSDDEEENSACPLCIKELDLEEQSFKPCPCGYQICLFCWHHIRDNINARCPACRREYTEEAVVWKPVTAEDSKRVQQQKKRKEKERKELESLGRKSYLDVRIVQRNVVYVVGLGPRFAKEETITVLRSGDYFGRYGKISRIQLQKRTPPGAETPVLGIYITYLRREDAERAIQAIDGSPSPSGGGEIMRASHGTAKYCTSFLRNVTCTNNNCLDAHEWGEPEDCFTREELTTLKHTIKDTEKRNSSTTKRATEQQEAPSLPRAASWASRAVPPNSTLPTIQTIQLGPPGPRLGSARQRQARNVSGGKPPPVIEVREKDKRRPTSANTSNSVTSPPHQHAPKPPGISTVVAAAAQDTASNVSSPQLTASVADSDPLVSPLPRNAESSAPPGLAAPPGLKPATTASSVPPEAVATATTTAPINPPPGLVRPPPGLSLPPEQASSKPYHLSKQAQALIDDVRNRREAVVATPPPIFPDFDRTLSLLMNSAGFSFSFAGIAPQSPEITIPTTRATRKSTFDPFSSPLERPSTSESSSSAPRGGDPRRASFSPFGDGLGEGTGRSRFDFARRQNSLGNNHNSRGSSPFQIEPSSNTLYNSSDMGFAGRSQGSWMSFQPTGLSRDYRHVEGTGGQFSSALTMPPSEHAYNELPPTPFDQMPITDNMREIVRGFETPAAEIPNRLDTQSSLSQQRGSQQHPANRQPVMYQQMSQIESQAIRIQGQINILSHRNSRDELSNPMMSPPIEASTAFSPYQQYQPSPAVSSTAAHNVHVNAQGSAPTKDMTSSTVNSSNAVTHVPAPMAFSQIAATAAPVSVTAGSSPQVSLIPSDDTEDFPALPTAAAESSTTRPTPTQPPTIPKLPPAPPVTRKVTAPSKPTKAETKKPALTPLTTNIDTKNDEAAQPSVIEVVSAISIKADNKAKKIIHEPISAVSVASTPVTASPATQSRTVVKPAKKAEKVEKVERPKSPTLSTSGKAAPAKAQASKGAPTAPAATQPSAPATPEVVEHAPIVARQTRKAKPQQLPKKKPAAKSEEPATKETTSEAQTTPTAAAPPPVIEGNNVPAANSSGPTSLELLFGQLQDQLDVRSLRFFSDRCLKSQEIVEYKPLIEALSTLAGDSHSQAVSSNASNVSTASTTIDSAMASFQQLLITLTQTVSDLLHLVPPSTWSDNGAFEEVIQEMLKYNFQDSENPSKELRNAVAKLEELHHDINSASTRAVLTVNDRGWDCASFLPRAGNTAAAYEMLGKYVKDGKVETMDLSRLEKQLAIAQKEVQTTSEELRKAMAINSGLLA